jgi:hypothetical protein
MGVFMNSNAITTDVQKKLKTIINNGYGTFSDLQEELSNTILNIYYRSIVRVEESEGKNGAWHLEPIETILRGFLFPRANRIGILFLSDTMYCQGGQFT